MPVISEPIANIAGATPDAAIVFRVTKIRERDDGTGTVVTDRHTFYPVDGVLTTTDLDAGPAEVTISGKRYAIVIPPDPGPYRLWPLIQAHLDPPAPAATGFVRDGGQVARIQALTRAQYEAIAVPDPETLYVITDSFGT